MHDGKVLYMYLECEQINYPASGPSRKGKKPIPGTVLLCTRTAVPVPEYTQNTSRIPGTRTSTCSVPEYLLGKCNIFQFYGWKLYRYINI